MKLNNLKGIVPFKIIEMLPEVMDKYYINTPIRLSHYLSQCAHESTHFNTLVENLNYSAEGLVKIFPKYFNAESAKLYARNPEKIANRVYANRMGNGDENSGDGWKYKGRGAIQLTGKSNYSFFDKEVTEDILNNPELVATKYPMLSAGWFWNMRAINKIADLGSTDVVVMNVTKVVNGGTIGLPQRIHEFNTFYTLLK